MEQTLFAFLISVGTITLAEMGDKTQLLAMAFAAKYKASKVLLGIFIATVLNHALAVLLGTMITRNEALNIWVQLIAGISFVIFGIWTIRGDQLNGEDRRTTRFGIITTVGIAFFIAELGDKTQLATIALATKFPEMPGHVLLGTTIGMLLADSIGIIIGVILGKRIPEKGIKLFAASLFILFGIFATWQALQDVIQLF